MWAVPIIALWLPMQAPDYESTGLKALDAKNYPAAVESFTKAVAADPKDYSAHFNLALAYSLLGQDPQAAAEYRKVLELKPDLYPAELNLGMLLLRDKNPRDAAPLLKSAAGQKPGEYRPAYYYGDALLQLEDFAAAQKSFEHALEIDPKAAAAELGLGKCLAKLNRLDEAAPHFESAARLDAGFKDSLLELASLYEAAGQNEKAIALYQQFPGNAAAEEHAGALLLAAKKGADAIPLLEAAVKRAPTAANRVALAQAYAQNREPDKALPLVRTAVSEAPGDFDLHMFYGRLLKDKKDYTAAAEQYLAAAARKPDAASAWNEYAVMMTLTDNYPQALAAFDKVRALGAEKPGDVFFRAIILDKLKNYKPALAAYRQFLDLAKGNFPDQEFQARQRARIIENMLNKR